MQNQIFSTGAIVKMIEGAPTVDGALGDLPQGAAPCRPSAIKMDKATAMSAMSGKRSASAWMRGAAWIIASVAYGADTPAALLKGMDRPSAYVLGRVFDGVTIGKGIDGAMLRVAVSVAWCALTALPVRTRTTTSAKAGDTDININSAEAAEAGVANADVVIILTKAETAQAASALLEAWATAFAASFTAQMAETAPTKKSRTKKARAAA